MSKLSESNMSFHGVIPSKKAAPLGQIALDVVFSDSKKLWISRVLIMQFWAGQLMHDLWLDCVTCTSN